MRKKILGFVFAAALLAALAVPLFGGAGPALAHEHRICTPGAGDPVIGEEPFHDTDPTGGAIANNPFVTEADLAAKGFHPIHEFLHTGPSQGNVSFVTGNPPPSC